MRSLLLALLLAGVGCEGPRGPGPQDDTRGVQGGEVPPAAVAEDLAPKLRAGR